MDPSYIQTCFAVILTAGTVFSISSREVVTERVEECSKPAPLSLSLKIKCSSFYVGVLLN